MGERGPRPLPSNVRRLRHGDAAQVNPNEPIPPASEISPPEYLSEPAVEVWRFYAPTLIKRGVLTVWDTDTFAILCDAIVQYREASRLVSGSSVLIRGRKDALVKNPAMQILRDSAMTVRAFAQEFGLTPSARSQLSIEQELARGTGPERLLS